MPARFVDLTGRKFNHLTAIEFLGFRQYATERKRVWRWRCDCGKEIVTPAMYVTSSGTKSCGCLTGQHKRTHGCTGTVEFRAWDHMRRRCSDQNHPQFKDYGGRGITVCERWLKFENFLADMGSRPSARHSLDRYPNNDGNYEPGNCRWATAREQSNNRRSSRLLTIHGKTKTLAQWEHDCGLPTGTVFRRLKAGWTPERAISPRVYRRGVERVIPTHVGG